MLNNAIPSAHLPCLTASPACEMIFLLYYFTFFCFDSAAEAYCQQVNYYR